MILCPSLCFLLAPEASLAFCLLKYCPLNWYVTLPSSIALPLPTRLSPVGVAVQNFSMCFLCCMEKSSLIMKHKEWERGRQRGICSAPQIFKVPLWPCHCRWSKKYFIISVIYFTSARTRPDYPLHSRLGFRERHFSFDTSVRKSHSSSTGPLIKKHVTVLTILGAKWSFWSTGQKKKPTAQAKDKFNSRTSWQINT